MARPEYRYHADPRQDFRYLRVDPASVVARTKEYDGSTTFGQTGEPATTGVSVSMGGFEEKVPVDDFGVSDVHRFMHKPENLRQLTAAPNRALGTWNETGSTYMDVSRVHKNTPRSRRIARTSMVGNKQISGFGLDDLVTEYNPNRPDVLERAGGNVELMEGEGDRWTTSEAPWGSEVVYGWTTEAQKFPQGRGKKAAVVPPGQGTFIFTGRGSQLQG